MKKTISVSVALLLLAGCGDSSPSESTLDSRAQVRAQKAVKELLRDGSSAEFRSLEVKRPVSGGRYVCGEVNSKNLLGAYTGYQQFVSIGEMTILQEQLSDFYLVWQEFCS